MPWATLFAGCAGGTVVIALLAHVATHAPLNQNTVRVTFLPAVGAMAFVPHVHFRPVIQATPVPTWIAPAGQALLALPVLAATCWLQLHLMTAGDARNLPSVVPLLAQLMSWSAVTVAIAACCERTRYAAISGAIAAPVSFAAIAVASFTSALERHLVAPPATAHKATIAWCTVAASAITLTCLASRDQWLRYARTFRR